MSVVIEHYVSMILQTVSFKTRFPYSVLMC